MKKVLLFLMLLAIANPAFAEFITPSSTQTGKYVSCATATYGEITSYYYLTIYTYNVTPGDELSLKLVGNSNITTPSMVAAWYSSADLSASTLIAPALLDGEQPLRTGNSDGNYELTVPEGASVLALSMHRLNGVATLVPRGESFFHEPDEYLSRTLPVMYVTTTDSLPITSKEEYLAGSYYLDPCGCDGVEAIGSADNQLPLQIKGRGNASWTYPKKGYRIKLDKKQALLGMPKNKHWNLMAHYENSATFTNDELGFELSRRMGLEWTPGHKPIELVLNGDYVGIYFITEKIRVEADRVNIVEQADEETDPENITGGWLVEIDNYNDPAQINITDGEGKLMRFTYHTPEVLSEEQTNYLTNLVTTVDNLIFVEDKSSREWEKYIDLEALARFYVVQEVIDNCESFSGSCYWHKEKGEDTKIIFGPVWDFGSAFSHYRSNNFNQFIYQDEPSYVVNHWIEEIAKFPAFQKKVREVWNEFYPTEYEKTLEHIGNLVNTIRPAVVQNAKRWDLNSDKYDSNLATMYNRLSRKVNFLDRMWALVGDVNFDYEVNVGDVSTIYDVILGIDKAHLVSADLNGDGNINAGDISTLYEIILATDKLIKQ